MRLHLPASTLVTLLTCGLAQAAGTPATVCIALPKAQLGQGNNAPTDVSEPVRVTLGQYMAGPALTLVRLDARIPAQIDAEAAQKGCTYVLQSSVEQKKGGGLGFLKNLAPLASAVPMMGNMGGGMGSVVAAQAVSSVASTAAMESAQQDAMQAMTGAQQNSVRKGDTMIVSYTLTKAGSADAVKQNKFNRKAKENGEDLLSPLLEQVATEVVTAAASGT